MLTAENIFMFTSNVLNEELNAPLFESVLTTQYSLHLEESMNSVPVDFVLELADCEAFMGVYDRDQKGWLSEDDLMIVLMPHSLSSIKSADEEMSFTGGKATTFAGNDSGSEATIQALLAQIITSEAIFLTKI